MGCFAPGKLLTVEITDHIVHLILSIYALGASKEEIQHAYDRESSYQRPAKPVDDEIFKKLKNKDDFKAYCGKREQYPNFFVFFQKEVDRKGIGAVINEYIFSGDEHGDDMLLRLFGGMCNELSHQFALTYTPLGAVV